MIFQSDLLTYTAIEIALADMRKNKFLLEDAYSCLATDPYMKALYGQKEIENFKAFIDKKIHLFLEHRPPDTSKFPCIAIQVGGGVEDNPKDAMGDSYQQEKVDPGSLGGAFQSPQIVLSACTPIEYDNLTGQVIFGDNVDLEKSHVFEGQFIYDEVNKKAYEIKLVMDSSSLLIEENLNPQPNLTGMTIRTNRNLVGHTIRSIWAWETHTLTVQATNATEVLYLYTILMYMLIRYKKTLWDARNFAIGSVSYGPIYRFTNEADPNLIYARDIQIKGRVEHAAIETTTPLIQGVDMEVKIADMQSPEAILPLVEKQGWEGQFDNDAIADEDDDSSE